MAAASRSRMVSELSRSRNTSPVDDNVFTTATSFHDIIHSTPQRNMDHSATQEGLPLHYDQYPEPSDYGSEGSADMSIEIGRGVKRGAHKDQEDMSSNAIFSFGNDNSQYEITGTPPVRARLNQQRKPESQLRKEASVRRATESAKASDALKRNTNQAKQRAVSDNSPRARVDDDTENFMQPTATFKVKSSRFSSAQHVSASYGGMPTKYTADGGLQFSQQAHGRHAAASANGQSTTHSAGQSFLLPELPNITELVSGARADGTPMPKRGPASRSRFTPSNNRSLTQRHLPVNGVPIPEDEKAIVASLNMLHDRVAQLEMDKSEAQKRIEEYEVVIIDLRSQLEVASRRPDSALGSDEDTEEPRSAKEERARLQAKVKALQERLDRSERKVSISEIAVTRVTRERDAMLSQIGNAYYQNEELVNENESIREEQEILQTENENLTNELQGLKRQNAKLREKLSLEKAPQEAEPIHSGRQRSTSEADGTAASRSARASGEDTGRSQGRKKSGLGSHTKDGWPISAFGEEGRSRRRDQLDSTLVRDLASRIEHEVQKYRDEAATRARGTKTDGASTSIRQRSKSRSRQATAKGGLSIPKRPASAPGEVEEWDATTDLDLTRKSQRSHARSQVLEDNDSDKTELSDLDDDAVANLRRKIEEERRAARLRKQKAVHEADEITRSATRQSLPRKSSLKDLTSRTSDGTGRISLHGTTIDDLIKGQKTVRVQSPHSSHDMIEPDVQQDDEQDVSILSNTSRRRSRAASAEGMTSAFIIPDITMNAAPPMLNHLAKACISHNVESCTACPQTGKSVQIPTPVPVTDRPEVVDVTDATIRPSQSPALALATVIKNLEDEIKHLKIQREGQNRLYNQHDPALSKRKRERVKVNIDKLTAEVEKRSDQVYALYDVLEGQKQAAQTAKERGEEVKEMDDQEVEETLNSIGIDPAELSGRVGRKAPEGLDGIEDVSDESELPWEGLSDVESEADVRDFAHMK